MAAEPEQAEESGASPVPGESPEPVDTVEDVRPEEVRPEDVREGVVDIVAYTVGALSLIALGYFTQRDVLTWTRGPFVVVCIIMAVHWAGRRIQAARHRKADGHGATGHMTGNATENATESATGKAGEAR
ncbi:MAG: hypothetical protein HOV68_31290 [Streptomycetaceae bacterium]|nr:hypothetical protein [Streptomycetaceae bacterium]